MPLNLRSCLLALFTLSLSAQQLPPAPRTHIANVTPKPGAYTEPAIAVNAKDPKQLVVAWQVDSSTAYSNGARPHRATPARASPQAHKKLGHPPPAFQA